MVQPHGYIASFNFHHSPLAHLSYCVAVAAVIALCSSTTLSRAYKETSIYYGRLHCRSGNYHKEVHGYPSSPAVMGPVVGT